MSELEGGAERRGPKPERELARADILDILRKAQKNLKLYDSSDGSLLGAISIATAKWREKVRKEGGGKGGRVYFPGKELQGNIIRTAISEGLGDNFFPREEKERWIAEALKILEKRHAR